MTATESTASSTRDVIAATAPSYADTPVERLPPVEVVHSLAPPDGRTKYVDMIVEGATAGTTIRYFTWKRVLTGDYDVFHVHWPELTIRGRSRTHRFLRRRALDLLLLRLRVKRIPLVRTVHNVEPHEPGSAAERRSLRRYDRATDLFIRLNPTTDLGPGRDVVTILHGHYRERFAGHPMPSIEPGRLLYFGIIRPYKGVTRLMDVFRTLDRPDLRLRVVGSPSVGQRELVEAACAADPRITSELRYVDDAELVDEIGRAELVILPYREMHNSGSILVALSLDRPVLVSASPSNDALKDEVGPGWIYDYEGELTAEIIEATLDRVRSTPREDRPRLSGRDWDHMGELHHRAYLRAIERLRGRRDRG
ncbi:beta-1,4-mannosyltransferase [Diaminobutyricimonas aerilata]|uniref:Beta-1,4-mannosyltransferase n=1 Tax=Diaminobutyricimonas aerilata TaxID=1162967 RepID=A0A2M9CIV9_9MICO|nr:glycosyltransferase [Diaminobutyricimonas aerilata]PJJ71851.1 beta-1,4-mannosyltransferase [Diaminobutyricimonas aerilata]